MIVVNFVMIMRGVEAMCIMPLTILSLKSTLVCIIVISQTLSQIRENA